jgi:hypothetical protein
VEKDQGSLPRTAGPAITNKRYKIKQKTDYILQKVALFWEAGHTTNMYYLAKHFSTDKDYILFLSIVASLLHLLWNSNASFFF